MKRDRNLYRLLYNIKSYIIIPLPSQLKNIVHQKLYFKLTLILRCEIGGCEIKYAAMSLMQISQTKALKFVEKLRKE